MKKNETAIGVSLIVLEVSLLLVLFTFLPTSVIAGVGSPNTTVVTLLEIGNVWPEILDVYVNDVDASLALTPANTTTVSCVAIIRDYNGEADINATNATFFDTVASSYDDTPSDNNHHYANASCEIIEDYSLIEPYQTYHADDEFHALSNCTFELEYYANPETWECRVQVNDSMNWQDNKSDTITVSPLLALGLPDNINYGTVDATYVSEENITNVTNYGNVQINLTLEGYAVSSGDGLAMNCTNGNIGTIAAMYEKYNLTASTPVVSSLSEFEASYTNITSTGVPVTKQFELTARTDDASNNAIKESYWRIYVPKGVAGTCTGNIIFGATTDAE